MKKKITMRGFTLIELLVVVSIITMLAIGGYMAYKSAKNEKGQNYEVEDYHKVEIRF